MFDSAWWRITVGENARPYWMHRYPGILKFLSAIEADLVGPLLNCEHATDLPVMTPKCKVEHPKRSGFHKSGARLRSQEPLASSQSSRVRILARAKAIEQSAAP